MRCEFVRGFQLTPRYTPLPHLPPPLPVTPVRNPRSHSRGHDVSWAPKTRLNARNQLSVLVCVCVCACVSLCATGPADRLNKLPLSLSLSVSLCLSLSLAVSLSHTHTHYYIQWRGRGFAQRPARKGQKRPNIKKKRVKREKKKGQKRKGQKRPNIELKETQYRAKRDLHTVMFARLRAALDRQRDPI